MQNIKQFINRIPYWVVAFAFALAGAVIYNQSDWNWEYILVVTLIMPGALKRLNWRHMLGAAGTSICMCLFLYGFDILNCNASWLNFVVYQLVPVVGLVFLESRLVQKKSSSVIKPLIMAVLVVLITLCLRNVSWLMEMDDRVWGHRSVDAWTLVVLRPTIAWILIPIGIRSPGTYSATASQYYKRVVSGIAFIALLNFIIVPKLAVISITSGTPFSRNRSILYRYKHFDTAELWQMLESDAWAPYHGWPVADWRQYTIDNFAKKSPEDTVNRLHSMLMEHPTPCLANLAAPYLLDNNDLEVVPILTRYALRRDLSDENVDALVNLGYPQAALLLIMEFFDPWRSMVQDMKLTPEEHTRLIQLLGFDVSEYGPNWYRPFWQEYPSNRPTTLTETIAEDVDRTLTAWRRHRQAKYYLNLQCQAAYWSELLKDGETNQLATLFNYIFTMNKYSHNGFDGIQGLTYNPEFQREVAKLADEQSMQSIDSLLLEYQSFEDRLSVAPVDWNIPTVTGLENEIDAYEVQVSNVVSSLKIDMGSIENFLAENFPHFAGEAVEHQKSLDQQLREKIRRVEIDDK